VTKSGYIFYFAEICLAVSDKIWPCRPVFDRQFHIHRQPINDLCYRILPQIKIWQIVWRTVWFQSTKSKTNSCPEPGDTISETPTNQHLLHTHVFVLVFSSFLLEEKPWPLEIVFVCQPPFQSHM